LSLKTLPDPVTSACVSVRSPHDFRLYAKLGLSEHVGPLPFSWSGDVWSSLVETEENGSVPVRVAEEMNGSARSLRITFYDDIHDQDMMNTVRMISRAFCTELDLNRFYSKTATDEKLWFSTRELRGLKPHLSVCLYEALIKAIVRQLVRASCARETISLLVREFGRKQTLAREVFYGFPTPVAIAKARKSELLRCKVGYKWKLIKEISRDVACGDLNLEDLSRQTNEEAIQILEEYSGVGYWTSGIFLYDGLKRLNAYPICDISLRRVISELYFDGQSISWAQVERFFEAWKDWIGILVTYLFGYLWLKRLGRA
jgi:3-methyladenine DNA glycosylase/8-oxoguanine DNA glycosylase